MAKRASKALISKVPDVSYCTNPIDEFIFLVNLLKAASTVLLQPRD